MKIKISTIVLLILTNYCSAQLLQTGVYSYDTLLSLNLSRSIVFDSTCPPENELIFHNCEPYVTGMNLFLRIDSVIGPYNSVRLWNYSGVLNPGDTFPISTHSSYNFFYYSPVTFFVSLIAAGTPIISGEYYYCNYHYGGGSISDGCGGMFYDILPDINSQNCIVDSLGSSISENISLKDFIIYPNPTSDRFVIENTNGQNLNLFVYNIIGELVLQRKLFKNKNEIDISSLATGMYTIRVTNNDRTVQKKIIKE